jgi:hypothetical protein
MAKNGPKDHKIYQHPPSQDHPKFTQIGIFGLKLCHLATLAGTFAIRQPASQITRKTAFDLIFESYLHTLFAYCINECIFCAHFVAYAYTSCFLECCVADHFWL